MTPLHRRSRFGILDGQLNTAYREMGCLPGFILFLMATAGGWWLDGASGAMWGALAGVIAGLAMTVAMLVVLRRASRGHGGKPDGWS